MGSRLLTNKLGKSSWSVIHTARIHSFSKYVILKPRYPRLLNMRENRFISFKSMLKKPDAKKLKMQDNIPEHYQLIYRNTMYRYLYFAQILTTTTVVIVVLTLFMDGEIGTQINFENWKMKPKSFDSDALVFLSAFLVINTLLQVMINKMPIRIYNYPKRNHYIMVFYGNLPFTKARLSCKVNEIMKLEETGILPWKDSRYEIAEKRSIILMENFFRRPADLNIMLGYQPQDADDEDSQT